MLRELKSVNKCTIFVLPLLTLGGRSFDEFIESYIDPKGKFICVEVQSLKRQSVAVLTHESMMAMRKSKAGIELWFRIPSQWWTDVQLFKEGKYSLMSEEAKSMIRTYSGLPYRMMDYFGYEAYTDFRLLALDKHPVLRAMWEERVDEDIPSSLDLLDIPGDREFRRFEI